MKNVFYDMTLDRLYSFRLSELESAVSREFNEKYLSKFHELKLEFEGSSIQNTRGLLKLLDLQEIIVCLLMLNELNCLHEIQPKCDIPIDSHQQYEKTVRRDLTLNLFTNVSNQIKQIFE